MGVLDLVGNLARGNVGGAATSAVSEVRLRSRLFPTLRFRLAPSPDGRPAPAGESWLLGALQPALEADTVAGPYRYAPAGEPRDGELFLHLLGALAFGYGGLAWWGGRPRQAKAAAGVGLALVVAGEIARRRS